MTFRELPKKWKRHIIILASISIVFSLLIVGFSLFLQSYRATNEQQRSILVKSDSQLIGERMMINRKGQAPVKVNIYYPIESDETNLPIVFNIHGGGFVGGDTDALDTQSQRIADQWNSVIVSVNYTKADVKPIDYGAEEIKDASSIIFDEATANVDPENEDKLKLAIESLTKNKTVIMIAHRLKTIRNANQILVLNKVCNKSASYPDS